MIKMIVSDMDGTLLRSDLSISQNTIDTINEARSKGIKFVIATGRPDQLAKEYMDCLDYNEPLIMCNGSIIGHPHKQDRLFEQNIKEEDARYIINLLEDHKLMYMVYTKDALYSRNNPRVEFFKNRNKDLQEDQQSIFILDYEIEEILDHKIDKILIMEADKELVNQILSKMDHIKTIDFVASSKTFTDIIPKGVSKGAAVLQIAKYHGIQSSEIIVFGDQDNDVSMFEKIENSVAMGNSKDEIKKQAAHKAKSNDQDGVAEWIKKHIL
jgi:Cof subfamily protein (haloacid dehalogenase superfamily)